MAEDEEAQLGQEARSTGTPAVSRSSVHELVVLRPQTPRHNHQGQLAKCTEDRLHLKTQESGDASALSGESPEPTEKDKGN